MTDLRQARDAARQIAEAALGRDTGPMAAVASSSHHVYVSPDVVVKIIEAAAHSRLDREIALAPHLPAGLTEALRSQCEVRDAAYLASDLRAGLERPGASAGLAADRLRGLEELITGHYWWHRTR
jgi:hypothetical protein